MAETKPVDMTNSLGITLATPQPEVLLTPNIGVIGVGGAGGNAVNNMIASKLTGVNFFAANTDAQALSRSLCSEKIQLGVKTTLGLGAGAHPEVGKASAEESAEQIKEEIKGLHLLFLTAGMGGGTGTGAAPVIASIAKEMGIMTVAVVSTPFMFEGPKRMRTAQGGIKELEQYVDTMVVVPNQNLFRVAQPDTTFDDAFKMADDVLCQGVRSITDLIMNPGIVNLDFADLTTVLKSMGRAMMGSGTASGENRALLAAEKALSNPLLDDMSMKGAKSVLINVSAAPHDLKLAENDVITQRITQEADPDAMIIWGTTFNEDLAGSIQVSIVATGLAPKIQVNTNTQTTASTGQQEHVITPPNSLNLHPVVQPQPESSTDSVTQQEDEQPTLLPNTDLDFMPFGTKMAAQSSEALVVNGHEEPMTKQENLINDPPPIIGPIQEITPTPQAQENINLEHKTAESNVKSVKLSLFDRVPGLLRSSARQKQAQKAKNEKAPPITELDLPSFFKE